MRMQFTFTFRNASVLATLEQAQKSTARKMSTFDTSPHVLKPQQDRSRAALARIVNASQQLLKTSGIDDFSMAAVAKASCHREVVNPARLQKLLRRMHP